MTIPSNQSKDSFCTLKRVTVVLVLLGAVAFAIAVLDAVRARIDQREQESNVSPQALRCAAGIPRVLFRVTRVIDGDTIEVARPPAQPVRVRLLCIDAAEAGTPGASEATAFLTERINGRWVWMEEDPQNDDKDRYGRLLRYVFIDDSMVNLELIRAGHSAYVTKWGISTFYDSMFKGAEVVAEPMPGSMAARQQAERPPPSKEPSVTNVTVYVTRTGAKYHRSGCQYLRQSCIPMELQSAKKRYSP